MQLMSKENKVINKIFPYDSSSTFRVRRIVNEKLKSISLLVKNKPSN